MTNKSSSLRVIWCNSKETKRLKKRGPLRIEFGKSVEYKLLRAQKLCALQENMENFLPRNVTDRIGVQGEEIQKRRGSLWPAATRDGPWSLPPIYLTWLKLNTFVDTKVVYMDSRAGSEHNDTRNAPASTKKKKKRRVESEWL